MMKAIRLVVLFGAMAVLGVAVVPTEVFAQAAIAGVARDETGAVLPGVSVEAASPALIEKTRVVYTDGEGVYRITDLRPGRYTVTFILQGFQTFRRDGVTLSGNAVATVNGEMRLGAIEETLTVTGEAPLVDVASTTKEQVLTRELLETIPTGRQIWTVGFTLPGVTLNGTDVGGSGGIQQTRIGVHGASNVQTTVEIDGMTVNSNHNNGGTQHYINYGMVQEMSFQTSGNSAETQKGGVRLNMIPQTGGNTFAGSIDTSSMPTGGWQSSNYTADLRRAGLSQPIRTTHLHDYGVNQGGPIKRDYAWFYTSWRHIASNTATSDSLYPQGHEKTGVQVVSDDWIFQGSGRVTVQASARHKLTGYFERSKKVKNDDGGVGTAWEAMVRRPAIDRFYDIAQAKWTGTMSTALLIESGWSFSGQNWTQECQEGINQERGTAAWMRQVSRQDLDLGTRWSACASNGLTRSARHTITSSVSYVTGSHALKTGVQWGFGPRESGRFTNGDLNQRYRSGVPNSVTVFNTPNSAYSYMDADLGVYVQDSWKKGNLTINPGLRVDSFKASVPALDVAAGRFSSARHYDAVPLPTFLDLSPRFGVSWDLFGDGRTALKFGANKYMNAMGADWALAYSPSVNASENRNWTDLNRDDMAQDSEIGPTNNLRFGIAPDLRPDDDLVREYNVEYNATLERQLTSYLSGSLGYYRRSYHNLIGRDNLRISLNDFTPRQIVSPLDGRALTIYNQNPATQGLADDVDRNMDHWKQVYNGIEASFQLRTPGNGRIVGGITVDRELLNNCSVDNPNANVYCEQSALDMPFHKLIKLTGFYPLPLGFQVSGAFMSQPGSMQEVTLTVDRTISPGLTQSSFNFPLVSPGTQYHGQVNQLDFGVGKQIGEQSGRRVRVQLDLFNALNSNVILNSTSAWGPNLRRPSSILQGRLTRLGMTFYF